MDSFFVVSLVMMGGLWWWERKYSRQREDELTQAHQAIMDTREHLQAVIDNSLPGTFNYVANTSQDEKLLVVVAVSDLRSPSYYLLNLRKPELKPIYQPPGGPGQPMQAVTYTARDGLVIFDGNPLVEHFGGQGDAAGDPRCHPHFHGVPRFNVA